MTYADNSSMRRAALAAALAAALLTPASSHAAPGPVGGCGLVAVNDTTPQHLFGGPTVWNGGAYVVVRYPGHSVAAWCGLRVDGGPETTVAVGASAAGVAAGASGTVFTADPMSSIVVCTHLVVDGGPETVRCQSANVAQLIPGQPLLALVEDTVCLLVESPCLFLDQLRATAGVYAATVTPSL